jgi:hypothetical protein
MRRLTVTIVTTSIVATLMAVQTVRAQHVTPARAATMGGPATPGCEERARQAAAAPDILNVHLERARQSNRDTEMRASVEALRAGLAEVKSRLEPCRQGAAPEKSSDDAMAGMDHSKMKMPPGKPPVAAPQPAAKPTAGGVDHAAMGHRTPAGTAGAATAPTTVRTISGPAEATLQAFQDALQIGNREVALRWLASDVTVTEWGTTDASRDAYAREHMAMDMAFLKTATVVILDRRVRPSADSAHIMTTSRVTGRAGAMPVDVTVTEESVVKRTPEGWRVASIEWSTEPAKARKNP